MQVNVPTQVPVDTILSSLGLRPSASLEHVMTEFMKSLVCGKKTAYKKVGKKKESGKYDIFGIFVSIR